MTPLKLTATQFVGLGLILCGHPIAAVGQVPLKVSEGACGRLIGWQVPSPSEDRPSEPAVPWMTRSRVTVMALAAEQYCVELGRYPSSLGELEVYALRLDPLSDPCRLDSHLLEDEWGTSLRYVLHGETPTIDSAGPDRAFGTSDDIGLPTPQDSLGFRIVARQVCFPRGQ